MGKKDIISINELCKIYSVPNSFINSLQSFELIDVIINDEDRFVSKTQINDIEKLIRLHFDLNINFEGLDVVNNLLKQIDELQQEVVYLKNKLDFHES